MTKGRRILFGRLHEGRYSYVQRASSWAGIFALPMVLSLSADDDLLVEPVPELAALRGEHTHFSDIQLTADDDYQLDVIKGNRLEIRAVFEWVSAEEFGSESLLFAGRRRANPYSLQSQSMVCQPRAARDWTAPGVDFGRKSVPASVQEVSNRESQRCAFELPYGKPLELRVFVDRSVVEVFANDRHYLAKRIYPARPDSLGVPAVYARRQGDCALAGRVADGRNLAY